MSTIEARLIFSAIDRASAVINRVGASMRAVNAQSLAAARQGMSRFTSAAAHLSIPAAFAARSMFNTAVGFDRIRNSAQAAGELTEAQIGRFEEAAKIASRELKVLPSQAMDAIKVLVKAGYTYEQTFGMLKPALEGAIAGMGEFGSESIEVAQSAELAAGIVSGLRLPMKTTEDALKSLTLVNDVVAKSANLSQANFREMGVSFKYAAPLAALTGNNIFELGAAFTVMAKSNIKADEAGVAVRSGIVRMLKPTKSMQAALKRLNLDLKDFVERGKDANITGLEKTFSAHGYDVSGVRKQLKALLADEDLQNDSATFFEKLTGTIAEGLGDESVLGKEKVGEVLTEYFASLGGKVKLVEFFEALRQNGAKASDLVNIFDVRQGGRLATLLSAELQDTVSQLEKEAGGASKKMAATMMKGAVGSLENLQSSWANLMIAIARSGVLDRVAAVMDRVAAAFDRMGKADPVLIERIVTGLAALSVAAPALVAVSSAIGMVAGAIGLLSALVNPYVVAIGLIAAGAFMIYNAWDKIKEAFRNGVDACINLVKRMGQGVYDGLMAGWDALTGALQRAWDRIIGIFDAAYARIMGVINAIRNGLAAVGDFAVNNKLTRGIGLAPAQEAPQVDGARAGGGDVAAGHTYRINERGQEFFTPSRSGRIIPHHRLAGGVTVNAPITLNITAGGANAGEIVRMAKARMREELAAALRGAIADTGMA